jgi:hypothetical protein
LTYLLYFLGVISSLRFAVSLALVGLAMYILTLCNQKRLPTASLQDGIGMMVHFVSIIGGLKLILKVLSASAQDVTYEMDKLYSAYGGVAILWIATVSICKKLKNPAEI